MEKFDNNETVYRVIWRTKDFEVNEQKFRDEDEARSFYYSITKPAKLRELDVIKEMKFYTILWELL